MDKRERGIDQVDFLAEDIFRGHMSVDHCRLKIAVVGPFLDGPYVIAVLERVRD